MIGSLRGYITHVDRAQHEVLIELASGIGYRVAVNDRTLNQIDLEGETLLYTHHQFIREGEQKLIGFCTQSEVATLETLVATPKVGPALALSILNTYGPAELAAIVGSDDIAALQAVNGVGKTTAQRVLVEMKDKLVVDRPRRRRDRRPAHPRLLDDRCQDGNVAVVGRTHRPG